MGEKQHDTISCTQMMNIVINGHIQSVLKNRRKTYFLRNNKYPTMRSVINAVTVVNGWNPFPIDMLRRFNESVCDEIQVLWQMWFNGHTWLIQTLTAKQASPLLLTEQFHFPCCLIELWKCLPNSLRWKTGVQLLTRHYLLFNLLQTLSTWNIESK